jgi:uncharacterized protein with von Willebrand factor type A (vWA) domain
MGSRRREPAPVAVQAPDTTAIQQQYQQSLQQIQQQNQIALTTITRANEASVQALNQQLAQSQQTNASYQQRLNEYLAQVQQAQTQQQQAAAERDQLLRQQQQQQQTEIEGTSTANNLMAANQVASSQFRQRTSRRRGFIA